jgi:hypothetical protein
MFPFGPVIGGVIVTVGVGLGLGYVITMNGNVHGGDVNQTKTFSAGEISAVHLDVDAADVHVFHGNGTDIQVHVYGGSRGVGNHLHFDAKASGSVLTVSVKHPWMDYVYTSLPWMGDWTERPVHVDVEIPNGAYDDFDVSLKAGDVRIEDLTAKQVKVTADAGNVRVSNLDGALNAVTHAGDITIDKTAGAMDLKTDAGEIVVNQDRIQHDVTAHTGAGSIEVNVATAPQNLQFLLNTSFGETETNLPNLKVTRNSSSDFEGSVGTGGPRVDLDSDLGNVSLDIK